jgi:hypothetical protein
MIEEIPHFLFFLNKREMHTKAKSRMWFSPDEIHTEALTRLVEHNLPTVVKEIREKVRQYFFDFEEEELQITAKMIQQHMLGGRYDSYYIIRECKSHFGIDFLRDELGNQKIKRCAYKWKIYVDTGRLADDFTVRSERDNGQNLVFKREDFLSDYELDSLYSPKTDAHPKPLQKGIELSKDDETPF